MQSIDIESYKQWKLLIASITESVLIETIRRNTLKLQLEDAMFWQWLVWSNICPTIKSNTLIGTCRHWVRLKRDGDITTA